MSDAEVPLKSVAQMAKFLGVGKATVYRGCHEADPARRWPHMTIAGQFKFTASHTARILALLGDEPHEPAAAADMVPLARLRRAARRLESQGA